MSYKSILTVVRDEDQAEFLITQSAALSRRLDAHLDIVCVGVDQISAGFYFSGADMVTTQTTLDQARRTAANLREIADTTAAKEDIRWSTRAMIVQLGAMDTVIGEAARYADLVILPQPYGGSAPSQDELVLEACLFSAEVPVLVLPPTGLPADFPRNAMIGWDNSSEALNAVRAAIPALSMSGKTEVVIIETRRRDDETLSPGEDLSRMLDRHGISAEITVLPKPAGTVSDALRQRAMDSGATLMVTGAYGHSRFREAILGGATRNLLENAEVPLLMTH